MVGNNDVTVAGFSMAESPAITTDEPGRVALQTKEGLLSQQQEASPYTAKAIAGQNSTASPTVGSAETLGGVAKTAAATTAAALMKPACGSKGDQGVLSEGQFSVCRKKILRARCRRCPLVEPKNYHHQSARKPH